MKPTKIGKQDYTLLESVNDINDKRFAFFKIYLLKSLEGIDRPLLAETMERVMAFFDKSQYMKAWGAIKDYHMAIEEEAYNEDALSKCFALICLEEGEDQLNVDENLLNEKLERLWANGLTRGFVEESVRNFTIESPLSFGSYSLMLEQVTQNLNPKSLKELDDLVQNSKTQTEKND